MNVEQLNMLDDMAEKAEELAKLCRGIADSLVRESRIEDIRVTDHPPGKRYRVLNDLKPITRPYINDPDCKAVQGATFSRRIRKPFEDRG